LLQIIFNYPGTAIFILVVLGTVLYFTIRFFYPNNPQPPEVADDGLSDSLNSSFFLTSAELTEIDYNADFNKLCADLPPE
jgi:hypothetical protein